MPLHLRIKKQYFDEIAAGTKKIEYREGKEYYWSRLVNMDENGEFVSFKPINEIVFINGYHKDAPRMRVAVEKIEFIEVKDNGEIYQDFAIHLGKVLHLGEEA
ncbi:MAG: ASCH domain-containing protein [Haliscomenobacter sp.]|nr:ASCH domain-containing protein [Haliscomenobacter sp.]MBP9873937.1 ASCH domain-containing protein [Haliscomenobacter sp.]